MWVLRGLSLDLLAGLLHGTGFHGVLYEEVSRVGGTMQEFTITNNVTGQLVLGQIPF